MKRPAAPPRVRPKVRRTLRGMGGRKIVVEGFAQGRTLFAIVGGGATPVAAWISAAELRRLVATARRILK